MADISEVVQEYVLYNGGIIRREEFDYSKTNILPGVYEVIRIIDGVPLFLEQHMSRFFTSANFLGYEISFNEDEITDQIYKLLEANNYAVGNIKLVINSLDKETQNSYMFYMPSKYPSEDEVKNGVSVILYHQERENPNAKSSNLSYRDSIVQEIKKHNAYEALLVNKENEITEGSKSNFFGVKGEEIYTAPIETILPGVTRRFILDICASQNIKVIESAIDLDSLASFDGLFITGTSPQVLPVSMVDDMPFDSVNNNIIERIRKAYTDKVAEYVQKNKKDRL